MSHTDIAWPWIGTSTDLCPPSRCEKGLAAVSGYGSSSSRIRGRVIASVIFNNFSHETLFGSFWTMAAQPGRAVLSNSIQKAIIALVKIGDTNDLGLGVNWVPATVSGVTIGNKLHFDSGANTLKNHLP